jgi:hypothetical protein
LLNHNAESNNSGLHKEANENMNRIIDNLNWEEKEARKELDNIKL